MIQSRIATARGILSVYEYCTLNQLQPLNRDCALEPLIAAARVILITNTAVMNWRGGNALEPMHGRLGGTPQVLPCRPRAPCEPSGRGSAGTRRVLTWGGWASARHAPALAAASVWHAPPHSRAHKGSGGRAARSQGTQWVLGSTRPSGGTEARTPARSCGAVAPCAAFHRSAVRRQCTPCCNAAAHRCNTGEIDG
jgi:hypothetical protein